MTETSPDAAAWASWLRRVWAIDVVGEAIGHASPELAKQVQNLCAVEVPGVRETRGAVLSVVRYLMRMAGRPTPNGLFAGVAPVRFAHRIQAQWGDRHQAAARADAGWLDKIIHQLQGRREILRHLLVVANTTLMVRGDRLIVPYQPNTDERGTSAVEVSMRHTAPARAALAAARAPIRFEDLCTKVHMEFPGVPPTRVSVLLTQLVTRRALVTSLHAPSTEPDALGHLLQGLAIAGQATADQAAALKQIHALLQQHQRQPAVVARALRDEAAVRMRGLVRTPRHPVAVDLRLDAHIVLPYAVAREAERAALLLARLSPYPYGTTALGDYHRRFYQRFGTGVQVPLLELVADGGIGWPDGYPGTDPPPRPPRTRRDETLSALAQTAALDGRVEVVLDEELIAELDQAKTGPVRLPSNLELCTRVDATSLDALQRGDFRLIVTSVSRAAGVVTGRFLHLLTAPEREALTGGFVDRPGEDEVLLAQLSFPPLDPATTHVTRTMQILPAVVSLAEHRDPAVARHVLTAGDLAVSCDSHRLYLTAPAVGRRVEAWGMHALNLRTHTPPLARLVAELSRAQCAQVTDFDWGAAATLPFLPRVRCGRVVLAPARWRLAAADLPGRTADWALWDAALAAWQARHRLPLTVYLVDGDWRLPLDLDEPAHRAVLREHLNTRPHAVLDEAPAQDAAGWCAGRAHEVIVPLAAQQPQAVSRLPRPSLQRVVNPGEHGRSPGTSRLLYAQLYGDPQRQDIVLAEHLPALLATWGQPQPPWWFLRFRHAGDHYLRLRIVLPAAEEFGDAVCRVSTWVDGLRRCGLLREVAYATSYPDTGRWGCGTALAAAQAVFTADSRAVVTQLAQPKRPHRLALAAANFAAITTAFTGTPAAGMRWLIEHVAAKPPTPVPRPVYGAAQRLADPREDFHALRQELGSALITSTWTSRAQALAAYRSTVDGPDAHGVDPNAALDSLLHTHFLRAYGVDAEDKAACLYLARAAALAFTAQTGQLP